MAPSQTKAVVAVLLLLMRLPEAARGANVLVVFPMGARSHWNLGRAIAMGLHAQGHHITAVTPFSGQGPPTNWTDVPLPNLIHFFGHTSGLFDLGKTNDFQMFVELVNYGVNSCEVYLQDENFKRLLNSDDKFDVMIMEEFFCECFLPLAHKFDIPVIGFTTFAPSAWQGDIVGNSSPYSHVPDTFLTYTDHMTFFERLHNTLYVLFCKVVREMYMMPRQEALVQKYLPDLKMPSLFEMEKRTSMVLTNSHFSLFYPKPLVPAMVEVGGMHVSPPKKLPQDLQEFLDGAKDGAILFSMGSNLKSADLPEEKRLAIVETFSKLKQRVLFKWEAETFPGKPTNMKVGKWLPQSDILAHKNVRLFITHGGLLSTLEAMYHGVPVIGIPIFCDQELNMLQAEAKGYGLKLHFSNITSDTFSWTISEVLNNSRYKKRAQQLSRLFHDRPRTPLQEVVYWTEYVVRHKGAPHMRSAALDLAWYQLWLLDVVGAVIAAAALALWILMGPSQMQAVVAVLLLLLSFPEAPRAAHVLVVFPVGAPSHWNLGRAIAKGLHAKGHRITAVTPFSGQGPPNNWTDVPLPNTIHFFGHTSGLFDFGKINNFRKFLILANYGIDSCEAYFQDENFKRLLNSGEKFDVMIMEEFVCDCLLVLAYKFSIPVIRFATFSPSSWQGDIVGNPSSYSYVPDTFLTYTDRMSFFQRLHNTVYGLYCKLVREMYMIPMQEALIEKYLFDLKKTSLSELDRKTSMLLTNSHFSLFYPRPLVPAMVEVGGMHVSPPKKLSQDLQEFLDGAKDGAILFSMGSNLKSADLPEDKRLAIVEAFSKLKQRVLFKWEAETFPGKPDNLKLGKWLPQSDILAHKNIKLFITHGGLLSTLEAVYHGVPVIGIPVFGDQELNMLQAEARGYGLRLHFSNITSHTLFWTVTEVLNNPRYMKRAQELSRLFHDRPRTPLEEVVYWTEYVVRHKGAPHMRSAALDLAWYQLWLLDVVGAVIAAAALALWILVVVLRTLFRLFGRSASNTTAAKKQS